MMTIYADTGSLFEKIDTCHSNPEKSSTSKKNKHAASGYSLFTHCSLDATKNKDDYYRGKDCMKRFSDDLKRHATKIMSYEKREIVPLTNEENKSYLKQKVCYICKKKLVLITMTLHSKNTIKHEITVIVPANIEALVIIFIT